MDIKPPQKPIKKEPIPLENNLRDMFNESNHVSDSFKPYTNYPKPDFSTNYHNPHITLKTKKKIVKKS